MAVEVFIAPLWEAATPSPDEFRTRVRLVALATIPSDDENWCVGEIDGESPEIEMPHGNATVGPDHVHFRLQEISPDLVRLVFAIAKQSGLAIVNEGGGPHIILVDGSQLDLLSPGILAERPLLCSSPAELANALAPAFEVPANEKREAIRQRNLLYSQWTRDHRVRSIGHGDPEPNVPGLDGLPRNPRPIYVEMKPKEGPLLQLRRFSRFLRAKLKSGGASHTQGGFQGSGWRVRLPTGEVFNCVLIAYPGRRNEHCGALDAKTALVEEFAQATRRRTAVIDEGQRLFVSDGTAYDLSYCESRRATDEDG
jgi:hypothetical protein